MSDRRRQSFDPTLRVEIVDEPRRLRALEPAWNGVVDRCPNASVFAVWDWIDAWWTVYGEAFEPFVLTAWAGDALVGIGPFVIRRAPPRRLEFFGQNRAYGEFLDLLVPGDAPVGTAEALARAVATAGAEGRWEEMHLATIPEGSPHLGLVERALGAADLPARRPPWRVCPYVELAGGWDHYLSRKSVRFRTRIRYLARRLGRDGDVSFEVARSGGPIEERFREYALLHERRWGRPMEAKFATFLERVVASLSTRENVILARLRVGGRTVATKLDLLYGGKIWGYQGGWLPELANLEVGSSLLSELLRWACRHGIAEYDFLEGGEPYKRRWATAERRAVDLVRGGSRNAYLFEGEMPVEHG